MSEQGKLSTREKVALGSAIVILVSTAIYWVTQIVGVVEMLKLAYG